jgi:uncharacterized Fe-S cluster protein YjdI
MAVGEVGSIDIYTFQAGDALVVYKIDIFVITMDKNNLTKEYSNGEITVVWQSSKCIHSVNCVKNLSSVFQPKNQPWIKMENAWLY